MRLLRFAIAQPPPWRSPNITAEVRKWVPLPPGQEQVDISFIKFLPGVYTTFHVHSTDQMLIAVDGIGFIETTTNGRTEFRPGDMVHCPAGERHRHGAVQDAHLDQVSIVVATRLLQ